MQEVRPANRADLTRAEKTRQMRTLEVRLDYRDIPVGVIVQASAAPVTYEQQSPTGGSAECLRNEHHFQVLYGSESVAQVDLDRFAVDDRIANGDGAALRVYTDHAAY